MSEATTTPTVGRVPAYIVYSRANWTDPWVAVPFMYPQSIQLSIGPSMSRATLIGNYGTIKREASASFSNYDPLDLKDKFVKIEAVDDPNDILALTPLFYGFVPAEELRPHKARNGQASGDYEATAYGLDYLLDVNSYILSLANKVGDSGEAELIGRVLPFNERYSYGLSEIGNRSASKTTNGLDNYHTFSPDGVPWTARDICEYVLAIFGDPRVPIRLGGQVEILDNVIPSSFNPDLMKIRDILNTMIDRRRGAGWRVKVVPGTPDVVTIEVFSLLGMPVQEGPITIPANLSPITVNLDTLPLVEEVSLNIETISQYDRIIARGARVKSVFSVRNSSVGGEGGDLLPAWTPEEQTAYDGLDDDQRDADAYRHVYTTFTMPQDGASGQSATLSAKTNPKIGLDGQPDFGTKATMRSWGYTLLRQLPIVKEWSDKEAVPEYRDPFAMVKNPATGRYHFADRLNTIDFPSMTLRMLDSQPGFELVGYYNHILGLNHFGISSTAVESSKTPLFDYEDMVVTVAVETDSHLFYTIGLNLPVIKTLTIDVPSAELWVLSAGTVTDINTNGTLNREAQSSVLRNDADRLKGIATVARAWYGVLRGSLSLTVGDIWMTPILGDYIINTLTGNYSESVESVVSQIVFDCIGSRTTVQTAYEELDFQRLDR